MDAWDEGGREVPAGTPEPPRFLKSHDLGVGKKLLDVVAIWPRGAGGANLEYVIAVVDPSGNSKPLSNVLLAMDFQNGDPAVVGVNGVTNEALLAIIEDRLKSFQAGPYACRENAIALTHLQDALHWLHHRTRERVARGVEGTSAL